MHRCHCVYVGDRGLTCGNRFWLSPINKNMLSSFHLPARDMHPQWIKSPGQAATPRLLGSTQKRKVHRPSDHTKVVPAAPKLSSPPQPGKQTLKGQGDPDKLQTYWDVFTFQPVRLTLTVIRSQTGGETVNSLPVIVVAPRPQAWSTCRVCARTYPVRGGDTLGDLLSILAPLKVLKNQTRSWKGLT